MNASPVSAPSPGKCCRLPLRCKTCRRRSRISRALRGYKYVNLGDQVIFVAPESRTVVGEIAK
jgi:hypothetical protein